MDDHLYEAPAAVPLYRYQPLSRTIIKGPQVPTTPAFALSPYVYLDVFIPEPHLRVASSYQHVHDVANKVDNLSPAQLQAGGYRLDWTLKRAMQEAFASLFEVN
jgi:hypothetical protein